MNWKEQYEEETGDIRPIEKDAPNLILFRMQLNQWQLRRSEWLESKLTEKTDECAGLTANLKGSKALNDILSSQLKEAREIITASPLYEILEAERNKTKKAEAKIKLLEACREYDASGENRPDGYIFTRHAVGQRQDGKT